MTDFQTNPEIDDELLSAYLDDELPPEERARVDARLAAEPAARRLLEQLQAASEAVHNLPHETIGEDLRESILRRAEAAMLASNGGRTPTIAAMDNTKKASGRLGDSLPRITIGQTRRGWVWAGLAIAAGLLIMIFQPGGQNGDALPQVAATRSSVEVDKVADNDRIAVPELRVWRAAEPASQPLATAEVSPPEPAMSPAAKAPVASGGASAPAPRTMTFDSVVPPPASGDATSASSDESELLAESAAAPARIPATIDRFGREAEGRDRVGGTAAAPEHATLAEDSKALAQSSGSLPTGSINGPVPESMSASRRELTEAPPESAVGGELQLGMAAAGEPVPSDGPDLARSQNPEADFLVVHVVIKPEALQNKAFEDLLAKNGVEWEEPESGKTAAAPSEDTLATDGTLNQRIAQRRRSLRDENARPPAEEVVLVAAPRDTIELCLSDLKQDQETYLGVSVDAPMSEADKDKTNNASSGEAFQVAKGLAVDFGSRFNRGVVPPQSAEQANERYFYDFYSDSGQKSAPSNGFGGGGGFGGADGGGQKAVKLEKEQSSGRDESSASDSLDREQLKRGRARRLDTRGYDQQLNRGEEFTSNSRAGGRRISSISALRLETARQQLQEPAAARQLNVLFVLSLANEIPAKTAPSPAGENRQE